LAVSDWLGAADSPRGCIDSAPDCIGFRTTGARCGPESLGL